MDRYLVARLLIINIVFLSNCAFSRGEIIFTTNPNCTSDCDKPWIIYGRQDNEDSVIHYLWSAVKLPSFLLAYSVPEANLEINWDELQNGVPGAIAFSVLPENIFGISFQTLILFNDVNDTGTLDHIPEADKKYASLSEFEWRIVESQSTTNGSNVVTFYTTEFMGKPLVNDTKISISVTAFDSDGRSDSLPHLITTPQSSQIEIVLNNLILDLDETYLNKTRQHRIVKDKVYPIDGFDHPRWALDAIIVSGDKPSTNGSGFLYKDKKSLDDEYTPGVFDLTSITTEEARNTGGGSSTGGYLQWRPVCYLTPDKDINDATYPNLNTSLPPIDTEHFENAKISLFYILFGDNFKHLTGVQTPIAFGLSKDKFYTAFNYTVWTFSMGLGDPPEEHFSTLIIIIISVAVGLPCTLFCIGGLFLAIRKFRRRGGELLINEL